MFSMHTSNLCRLNGETFSISYTLAVGFFKDLKPEGDVIITEAKPRLL